MPRSEFSLPPILAQYVSRETIERLAVFHERLIAWQARINLVSDSTLPLFWNRHVADSIQLLHFAPKAKTWVDIGTGGGFPGLVIAICLSERTASRVVMYEKSKKKCAFLREVSRLTSARGIVINQEFHANHSDLPASIDVVCARAVAPLAKLLELTQPIIARGALGLFPKGQNVDAEVTEATRYWKFDLEMRQSLVDKQSTVVAVRSLEPRSDEQT